MKFKAHKYVGDPINAIRIFNDKQVDELIFLDIDASRNGAEPDIDLIKDLASECFMPFAYGGGVSTIDHIRDILRAGVEKVVLNHQAMRNIAFVKQASEHFGSSTIIGAIDFKKDFWGSYKVYDHVTQKTTAVNAIDYARDLEAAGVGEIFLNNVDRDGTYNGFDNDFIKKINDVLSVPLIVCGGASGLDDIKQLLAYTNVSAVAAGSIFVYQGPHRAVLISYPSPDQLKALSSQSEISP